MLATAAPTSAAGLPTAQSAQADGCCGGCGYGCASGYGYGGYEQYPAAPVSGAVPPTAAQLPAAPVSGAMPPTAAQLPAAPVSAMPPAARLPVAPLAGEYARESDTYVQLSPRFVAAGQEITATATVYCHEGVWEHAPGGTVRFLLDGVQFDNGPAVDGEVSAPVDTTGLTGGRHTVEAMFDGFPGILPDASDSCNPSEGTAAFWILPQGPEGPQGPQGPQGPPGRPGNIHVHVKVVVAPRVHIVFAPHFHVHVSRMMHMAPAAPSAPPSKAVPVTG